MWEEAVWQTPHVVLVPRQFFPQHPLFEDRASSTSPMRQNAPSTPYQEPSISAVPKANRTNPPYIGWRIETSDTRTV